MNRYAEFGYAQARLQARHGDRAAEAHWTQLRGTGDLGHFLQIARNTPLRPWVIHLSPQSSIHEVEYSLRRELRTYILEVARWQPAAWRAAAAWCVWLVDLPALQHLMREQYALQWMFDDPVLKGLASENLAMRKAALGESAIAPLFRAWQRGQSLPDAWQEQWRALWPTGAPRLYTAALEQIAARFETHRQRFVELRPEFTDQARQALGRRLELAFRRLASQPAAAYLHLALIALDLERLRGELVRRALFGTRREDAA